MLRSFGVGGTKIVGVFFSLNISTISIKPEVWFRSLGGFVRNGHQYFGTIIPGRRVEKKGSKHYNCPMNKDKLEYQKPGRTFENSGTVNPRLSYYVPLENVTNTKNQDMKTMVDLGRYFSIFAPRQSGKTTFLKRIRSQLHADPTCIKKPLLKLCSLMSNINPTIKNSPGWSNTD